MNKTLTIEIINHIFSNLGLTDKKVSTSLMDEQFLTNLTIDFEIDNEEDDKANVWMASGGDDGSKITLACSNFSSLNEIAFIVEIEKCPTYGCFLEKIDDTYNGLIGFSIKENVWLPADIYTQALFLAGMEKFKDLTFNFSKCKETKIIYDRLIGFINWYEELNK